MYFINLQTLQEELTGAAFHPLDDNLLITHGKGHLAFWNRRKDGFFERTDIIKPVRLLLHMLFYYKIARRMSYFIIIIYLLSICYKAIISKR